MTTISNVPLAKTHNTSLMQAQLAMEVISQDSNKTLSVSESNSAISVNNTSMSEFISGNSSAKETSDSSSSSSRAITRDTITFSPAASQVISNQQTALNVIQYSENRSNGKTKSEVQQPVNMDSSTHESVSIEVMSTPDESSSAIGKVQTPEEAFATMADYASESPAERFYNSDNSPSEIPKEFFASTEQQASYIAAYNSGTLNIQSASSFEIPGSSSTTSFSGGGMSSSGSGPLDLSSIKDNNIITVYDPIAGSLVVSWSDRKG